MTTSFIDLASSHDWLKNNKGKGVHMMQQIFRIEVQSQLRSCGVLWGIPAVPIKFIVGTWGPKNESLKLKKGRRLKSICMRGTVVPIKSSVELSNRFLGGYQTQRSFFVTPTKKSQKDIWFGNDNQFQILETHLWNVKCVKTSHHFILTSFKIEFKGPQFLLSTGFKFKA